MNAFFFQGIVYKGYRDIMAVGYGYIAHKSQKHHFDYYPYNGFLLYLKQGNIHICFFSTCFFMEGVSLRVIWPVLSLIPQNPSKHISIMFVVLVIDDYTNQLIMYMYNLL